MYIICACMCVCLASGICIYIAAGRSFNDRKSNTHSTPRRFVPPRVCSQGRAMNETLFRHNVENI